MNKCLVFLLSLLSLASFAAPLPANEVFKAEVSPLDPNTFLVKWDIKPGYFLYRDRIHIKVLPNSNIVLGNQHFPETVKKMDGKGHLYNVYRQHLALPVSVLGKQAEEAFVSLRFQGCSDEGFCYPPEQRQIKLDINDKLTLANAEFYEPMAKPAASPPLDPIESVFLQKHGLIVLITFFCLGLLMAFTPCVLPMVPVLSGIIIGHGHTISTRKAFFLSLSYVLSMAITYAIIGAVVALLGSNLQLIMQAPWVITCFSLLFVLLALSMFGYFELKLPLSWQARLAGINRSQASGHYISAAIMGCLSTLILSPCVTAPLIGALSYIAHSGNVVLGASSLFFLSLGMGTPLLLIGTSARGLLPKAGHWMSAIQYFFGVMLLAVAIYLMSRILPGAVSMLLWAILLIFSGIYAGALARAESHHEKFKQASGIILLGYGLLILIGVGLGSHNPLQPLSAWASHLPARAKSALTVLHTVDEVKTVLTNTKKPILLDFYAKWCATCKTIESRVLQNPKIIAAMQSISVYKIDISANSQEDKALLAYFKVIAPPTFLFFNRGGKELAALRLAGDVSYSQFLGSLKQL